jgi:hypothetical protein
MTTKKGDVYGFVTPEGKVYLDPKKMNANTPIHEFGHLWNSFIKDKHLELWQKGSELIKNSPYMQAVNSNPAYSGLSEAEKIDEAMAMLIGDKGEAVWTETQNLSGYAEMKGWPYEAWNVIKEMFGVKLDNRVRMEDMTLEDFTGRAVTDLLGGKNLYEKYGVEMQRIKAEAKADGTFMKAPNGKATKLNERQWLQVRTEEFKKWFGDWELANKLQSIEDLAAIGIRPHQYTREQLNQLYRDTENGKNKFDNREVVFTHNVFGKMFRFGTDGNFAKIVPQLKGILIIRYRFIQSRSSKEKGIKNIIIL